MNQYEFCQVRHEILGPVKDNSSLKNRPCVVVDRSFAADAKKFVPGAQLETSINAAIAVGAPLLITGEPGTGKTQAAYYTAYKMNIEPVIHYQVKSESTARDLLYHFDTVRYFHDAHMAQSNGASAKESLSKSNYVEKMALWLAFDEALKTGAPRLLLIDEIDKAPRDFPNDLLHELDKMEFAVPEISSDYKVTAYREHRPIVFITSNSERRLPEPFLRRCVYHHIKFDDQLIEEAVRHRRNEFGNLSEDFLAMAIRRFLTLRTRSNRKQPSTSELLIWLRVLAAAAGASESIHLDEDLSQLPYLGSLLKDHQDLEDLRSSR